MRYLVLVLVGCGSEASTPPDAAVADVGLTDTPLDAPDTLNGCTLATATDFTAVANRTVEMFDDAYTPKCIRITVGQDVTWNGDLSAHPLAPGRLTGGGIQPQAGNPIPPTNDGASVTVAFTATGEWAFYCPIHLPGMTGAVFVVP
jgi:plastocyanin